jgi:hypothetical protein
MTAMPPPVGQGGMAQIRSRPGRSHTPTATAATTQIRQVSRL